VPQFHEPTITLRFDLTGRETTAIKSYRIDSAFMVSTDGFELTLYEPLAENRRHLELQPVSIFIDGLLQVVGRIDETVMGGGSGHEVAIRGRDYIADMVESHVDPSLRLEDNMTLGDVVKLAARPCGITAVEDGAEAFRNVRTGVNTQSGAADATFTELALQKYKANPGEGTYQFLNRICARHACTIQPTQKRTSLALAAPDYEQQASARLTRRTGNPASKANTIKAARATRNYSSYPTFVFAVGKQSKPKGDTSKTSSSSDLSGLVSELELFLPGRNPNIVLPTRLLPSGEPKTPAETLYRLLYIRDEQAKKQEQLDRTMRRAVSERVKDSLQYTVTLRGHRDPDTSALYQPDTIVEVADDVCDVNERLWVERRTFSYDEGGGPTTELTCWRVGAFQL
jgi:prophage tail gpP-like protein